MIENLYMSLTELQECDIQVLCNMFMLLKGLSNRTYREECTYWMCVMEVNRREVDVFPESQEVVCLGNIYDGKRLSFKKHEKYMLYAIDEIMLLYSYDLIPYLFNMIDGDDMCVWTRFGLSNKPDAIADKEYVM